MRGRRGAEAEEYKEHVALLSEIFKEGGDSALAAYCSEILQAYADHPGRNSAQPHIDEAKNFLKGMK